MADKKLIATTVSSHEKGLKRREEGKTTSSQRKTSTQGNQDESKRNQAKPKDESPIQRRDRKHDIDERTRRTNDMRSKGGGRLQHCNVDGDVPLSKTTRNPAAAKAKRTKKKEAEAAIKKK